MSTQMDFPTFVIVDSRGRILYTSEGRGRGEAELNRITVNRKQLQPEVAALIQGLPSFSRDDTSEAARSFLMSNNQVLRVVRLTGADGSILMLTIEPDRNGDSLGRAVRRFQLTRRETEVLALILDGFSARETADILAISEHTVQGYFKRLLSKTNARNRVSMVASILEWNSPARTDRPAGPARMRQ